MKRKWEAKELPKPKRSDLLRSGSIAKRQMREAEKKHRGETHSNHCWARLAWGDGECECDQNPDKPEQKRWVEATRHLSLAGAAKQAGVSKAAMVVWRRNCQ